MSFSTFDNQCMQRALAIARKGQGWVEPNPMVGCVLTRNGSVISEGFHCRFGQAHAEIEAIRRSRGSVRGATAYVTLEPCCHVGKTPPCTRALIEAGIARVVAAIEDPFPQVAGRGLAELRSHGVETRVGLCEDDARQLLAPYLKRIQRKRPYVILKWAQSIDGKIATRTGDSKWISSEPSRRFVHRLRARVDAILVGVGTLLADNPRLTARDVPIKRDARRVVLDTRLRTPTTAAIFKQVGRNPVLIATSRESLRREKNKVRRLERFGAEVRAFPCNRDGIALPKLLQFLAQNDATNVLVEGGSQLLGSFFDAQLVDEAFAFVAPLLIGGAAAPCPYPGIGRAQLSTALRPSTVATRRLGPDTLFHLEFAQS